MTEAVSKASDNFDDGALFKKAGAAPHFSKFTPAECPDILKIIDWNAVSNELAPLLREDMGSVELEPPGK